MAAATWEQFDRVGMPCRTDGSSALSPSRAPQPSRTGRRGQLRLVPAGPQVERGLATRPSTAAHVDEQAVRITRRGRLAVTLLVTAAVLTLTAAMWSAGSPAVPTIDHTTTVSSGQTLSQVAAEQMPGVPVQQAVNQIQLANDLSSSQVHAGQVLQIPAMP